MAPADDPPGVAGRSSTAPVFGVAFTVPLLPAAPLALGGPSGAVGSALLASVLAVLLLPLALFSLYQMFALADR